MVKDKLEIKAKRTAKLFRISDSKDRKYDETEWEELNEGESEIKCVVKGC